MRLGDVIEVGFEVVGVINDTENLKKVGDKETLPPVRVRVRGRRLKLTLEAEVEG